MRATRTGSWRGCLREGMAVRGLWLLGVLVGLGVGLAEAQGTSTVLWRWEAGTEDPSFGFAVAGVGDVNGDGIPDIIAGVPELSLTTDRLDFGSVRVGRNFATGFTLRNDGGAPLTITALGPPTPPFYLDVLAPKPPFTVQPGQMESIIVVFIPRTPGRYRQQLLVGSTDPDEPVTTVTLTGWGREKRTR